METYKLAKPANQRITKAFISQGSCTFLLLCNTIALRLTHDVRPYRTACSGGHPLYVTTSRQPVPKFSFISPILAPVATGDLRREDPVPAHRGEATILTVPGHIQRRNDTTHDPDFYQRSS